MNYRDKNIALVLRIQQGDKKALAELITLNKPLIYTAMKSFKPQGIIDYDDYFQEACLGLTRAAYKFNPERGCAFSTYATQWIRQALSRHLVDAGTTIRKPNHVYEKLREHSRSGAHQEYFDMVNRVNVVSLNKLIGDESQELMEFVGVAATEEHTDYQNLIKKLLPWLSARERFVIENRFGLGVSQLTLQGVGDLLGVSRERVRQVESRALRKLRNFCKRYGVVKDEWLL